MPIQYPTAPANLQASPEVAHHLAEQLEAFFPQDAQRGFHTEQEER